MKIYRLQKSVYHYTIYKLKRVREGSGFKKIVNGHTSYPIYQQFNIKSDSIGMKYFQNLGQMTVVAVLVFVEHTYGLPALNEAVSEMGKHIATQTNGISPTPGHIEASRVNLDTATLQMNEQNKKIVYLRNLPRPQIEDEEEGKEIPRRVLKKCGKKCRCQKYGRDCPSDSGPLNAPNVFKILPWFIYIFYQNFINRRII